MFTNSRAYLFSYFQHVQTHTFIFENLLHNRIINNMKITMPIIFNTLNTMYFFNQKCIVFPLKSLYKNIFIFNQSFYKYYFNDNIIFKLYT